MGNKCCLTLFLTKVGRTLNKCLRSCFQIHFMFDQLRDCLPLFDVDLSEECVALCLKIGAESSTIRDN